MSSRASYILCFCPYTVTEGFSGNVNTSVDVSAVNIKPSTYTDTNKILALSVIPSSFFFFFFNLPQPSSPLTAFFSVHVCGCATLICGPQPGTGRDDHGMSNEKVVRDSGREESGKGEDAKREERRVVGKESGEEKKIRRAWKRGREKSAGRQRQREGERSRGAITFVWIRFLMYALEEQEKDKTNK